MPAPDPPQQPTSADLQGPATATVEAPRPASPHPLWNFITLAVYQIVNRTGWIFKTESIIMPAVLDTVAGPGWIRGWLPLLNRFGNSVPPLLFAHRVKDASRKKWIFGGATALRACLFLLLASLFSGIAYQGHWWMPVAFLAIYTTFFMCIGINNLAFHTLQGKLVQATSRGRLLLVSNAVGAVTAVLCVLVLLPGWLAEETPRFDLVFGFSGAMFGIAALTALLLFEEPDDYDPPATNVRKQLAETWRVWRGDANFRRLTAVAAAFGASIMLFPHYQNLGLQRMKLDLQNLMWWVIIQNIGTGFFSIPAGRLADRKGNRAVLKIALLGIAAAPLLAIGLHHLPGIGTRLYSLVFLFVGLTPVVLRTLQNLTLELSAPEDHPRYLSTLGICLSAPMFFGPLVGLCVDLLGFTAVFLTITALVLWGWSMAFGLHEPREHITVGYLETAD